MLNQQRNSRYELNKEFCIIPYGNGFKVLKPEKINKFKNPVNTINSLMQSSLNISILNAQCNILATNETCAKALGFMSVKEMEGISVLDIVKGESGKIIMSHNKEIVSKAMRRIDEENYERKDDVTLNALVIKKPWYNEDNQVNGVFCCSFVIGTLPLSESLALIEKTGFLNLPTSFLDPKKLLKGLQIHNIYITSREVEVLQHIIKGKTAKQIGLTLQISHRTVETHIENVKYKFGVNNKTDLIEKVIEFI